MYGKAGKSRYGFGRTWMEMNVRLCIWFGEPIFTIGEVRDNRQIGCKKKKIAALTF